MVNEDEVRRKINDYEEGTIVCIGLHDGYHSCTGIIRATGENSKELYLYRNGKTGKKFETSQLAKLIWSIEPFDKIKNY